VCPPPTVHSCTAQHVCNHHVHKGISHTMAKAYTGTHQRSLSLYSPPQPQTHRAAQAHVNRISMLPVSSFRKMCQVCTCHVTPKPPHPHLNSLQTASRTRAGYRHLAPGQPPCSAPRAAVCKGTRMGPDYLHTDHDTVTIIPNKISSVCLCLMSYSKMVTWGFD
jgi:hypothetical protein